MRAGMADALFSTTQQRVLGLLFGQPERSFYTKELIALADSGSGTVQRELERLHESGLVTRSILGTQKHYRANPASPVFGELVGIVTKTLGPASVVRDVLHDFASGVHFAFLFGSVAKRADHAGSDIDVVVVSDTLTLESVFAALSQAERALGRTVNPTLYTTAEFRRRLDQRQSFLAKVLASEHVVLVGALDNVVCFEKP